MGVDLQTYRGRIGTYRHSIGQDVITVTCVINFSCGLKSVGAVLFIGVLLLIAGIESNPGPGGVLSSFVFTAVAVVIIGLFLQVTEWKTLAFYFMCLQLVVSLFLYGSEQDTQTERKESASQTEDNKDQSEVQLPISSPVHKTKSNNSETDESLSEHSGTSINSDNEDVPKVQPLADPEFPTSKVLQKSPEQSEASQTENNNDQSEVQLPIASHVHETKSNNSETDESLSEQSGTSSHSENEGISQVQTSAKRKLHPSIASVLQNSPEQSEGSSNSKNEGVPQVPSPTAPELLLSTSSFVQRSPEHSEASINSNNEDVPQVQPQADLELPTSNVLQRPPVQSKASQTENNNDQSEVQLPIASHVHETKSNNSETDENFSEHSGITLDMRVLNLRSEDRSSRRYISRSISSYKDPTVLDLDEYAEDTTAGFYSTEWSARLAGSSNSTNEEVPQVPSPTAPELPLSTSSFVQKSPLKSEASSNSDNAGMPQVQPQAGPELPTSKVLQKSPEQSKEKENFCRMSLLIMQCGMPLLKHFILHKAQEKGKGIDAMLQLNKHKLERQLHKELKKIVFPHTGRTNLDYWDFSTIAIVLLLVFKPFLSGDEKDAIQKIKSVRDNVFAHANTLFMSVNYYDRHRKDVKQSIETLIKKLDISKQNEFRTILNDCENGPISEMKSIEQTIETQFQELRDDMKKSIHEGYKTLIKEGKTMKKCEVIGATIKISGKEEDTAIIELAYKTILDIFNKAIKRSGAYEFSPLEKAVQEIVDSISDMGNAKLIGALSGSIILNIEVSANETLLATLEYIEGKSMDKKLEAVTDELVKSKILKPSCSTSAAVSQHTLLSLYDDLGKNATQPLSVPTKSPHTRAASVKKRTANAEETQRQQSDSQTPNQTQVVEKKENIETEPNEIKGITFYQMLQTLGLTTKYPGKITMQNVIAVDPNEANEIDRQRNTFADIPWMMLKRLICAHSEARDISVSDEECMDLDNTMAFLSESLEESQDISPLDIFIVVFQCCDPLLKQILFQKLYLCKIAVPFLYRSWETNELHHTMLAVWPLRSLAIENHVTLSDSRSKSIEVNALELTSHVLAFARYGRPKYSKSKLLNSLLSSQGCKTFFNNECPSGMTPKYLSDGQIEMFWLPKVGGNKDRFQDAMTFLNMRGDIKGNFNVDILTFIAGFVDTIAIIIDSESMLTQTKEVKDAVLHFSSIILIITNPLGPIIQLIENFKSEVISSKPSINLRVISTYKGVAEQNNVAMVSCISKYITDQVKSAKTKSYQERLSSYRFDCSNSDIIKTDEGNKSFQNCKVEAKSFVKLMKTDSHPSKWKKALTPVHCNYSQQLGKLMKKRERARELNEFTELNSEIKTIRERQSRAITKTVKQFLQILSRESSFELKIFLSWLHFYIEQEKRQVLPQLMHESRCAWEKLKTLKSAEVQVPSEIEKQETVIIHLEEKIDEAAFSVEHLFREVGHIYDAILTLNENVYESGLPPTDQIANSIANLVVDGHQLELIDGDSFYMPHNWTKTVLQSVDRCIGSCKVMTLSVLGVQSSGKSTLLNTMFGSQFSTRTGRCTKGIHVQLVPVNTASLKGFISPFHYILIVDTEGLRSLELSHVQHEHDNELATVITGLGDVTLLNIMGENASEMRDILQVIVHAFLRLKMTNRSLDIRKCCTFIHQNVSDNSAPEKMISGLSKLMQTLDEMTKESAQSEGILDITTFNQVIEFDIKSQVWYLKNLWEGNPPMARVNNEYSERVVDMKCKVLHRALTMKDKSYKTLTDIITHAHSLWKGVLNEDFVFSFRNSLEIRAYMEMERVVQDHLWHLESFIREKLLNISQNKFAGCDQKYKLRNVADKLIRDLKELLADEKCKTEGNITTYFEKNKNKDITIQWKHSQQCRIETLCFKLAQSIREQIEKRLEKRSVEIFTVASRERHEEELRQISMEVANKYKNVELSKTEITKFFDKIWQSFMNNILSTTQTAEQSRKKMQDIFIDCLRNRFVNDHFFLKQSLEQGSYLKPISRLDRLEGSFELTGINNDDVSFTFKQKMIRKGKKILGYDNTMESVAGSIDQIFVTTDNKIRQICQVNDEITEMTVNNLMHELDDSLLAIPTENSGYKFKTPFYVKVHVHVSRYVHLVFEKHNEMYLNTLGIAAPLEQYRQQQVISFEAHLSNRKSEDIVAKLFSHVIEGFAEEWTSQNLPNKITDELFSKLPSVKNRVIIEICSDLLDIGDFKHFMRYLLAPSDYVNFWITEKANNYLFSGKSRPYARMASSLLNRVFTNVETCLNNIKASSTGKSSPSIEMWIHDFQVSLKEASLSIPPEHFRNVKMEKKQIENVEYLTNEILANMVASREKLYAKYSTHDSVSVTWTDENPIERIIKKISGCPEQCAFCGEPCAKTEDHSGSMHYSIQHRPSCCIGTRDRTTDMAFLTACEFNIQSEKTHNCQAFRYACNKETRKDFAEYHPFRDYKTFLPEWDIPPSSNMHDTSTFWMWFVATYKQDLHKYYKYKVDNIPTSWNEISKEQARESLNKIYLA